MSCWALDDTALSRIEFVRIYLHLEFSEPVELPPAALLQLRRELLRAMQLLQQRRLIGEGSALQQLLQPDLPHDPILIKRVQKPAPAFVISPDVGLAGSFQTQDRLVLPFLLFGPAMNRISDIWQLFDCLGELGIYKGTGRFIVEALEGENSQGQRAMLWMRGEPRSELTPPVRDLGWWLGQRPLIDGSIRMLAVSPLRLVRQGRPLFKAAFFDLFPFVLRRVSSLLALYGGYELSRDDVAAILSAAEQLETQENCLRWEDWRRLEGERGGQSLGGLLGELTVVGDSLTEIAWLLQLGSLFNVGKGAAYGAGQYRLLSVK